MLTALIFLALVSTSQRAGVPVVRVHDSDLDSLIGKPWKGSLTYLDYTSKKETTIKSTLVVDRLPKVESSWTWSVGYSDEPSHNAGTTLKLTLNGTVLDGEKVIERTELPGKKVEIETQFLGNDDNRPAVMRHVYVIGDKEFTLQKLVKFKDGKEFFQRNIYRWSR